MSEARVETIREAIRGVLGDPEWLKRVAVGVAVMLIPYVGAVWVMGYELVYLRELAWGRSTALPRWKDAGTQLRTGLYAFVAGMVYSLPFSLLIGLGIVAAAMVGTIGFAADGGIALVVVTVAIALGITALASVLAGVVLWPVYTHVALHDTIESAFRVSEILARVKGAAGAYRAALWRSLVVSLLMTAVSFGLVFGVSALLMLGFWRVASGDVEPDIVFGMGMTFLTPMQMLVGAAAGFITLPAGLVIHRLWAGYARIAYGLDTVSAGEAA